MLIWFSIKEAAKENAELIVFGEALLPGYPFWLALTEGASWDKKVNKELHAHYVRNAIQIEAGELETIQKLAKENSMAIYLGIMERAKNRGGNWMPLPRTALYGQGENLHIAVWPGSEHNTKDITRFIARESRSYVLSVSSLMAKTDFPKDTPHLDAILKKAPDTLANGGSCIAGPDGEWIIAPVLHKEGLIYQELDFNRVYEERQNFDVVGHYSRPDVTKLTVNRERQSTVEFED